MTGLKSFPLDLSSQLTAISTQCSECGACVKSCAFLKHYGTPSAITRNHDFTQVSFLAMAYECSLCGLCTAVCPEKLEPSRLFLTLRRIFVAAGHFDPSVYRTILGYEHRGRSRLFAYQGLPADCDTVFFPGCNLPGSRMATTLHLYEKLRSIIPALGVVLNCCSKPSHDLGRQDHFEAVFGELRHTLQGQGVRRVLVACPNCYTIFHQYGEGLSVQTIYEYFAVEPGTVPFPSAWGAISVHDPCAMRNSEGIQQAVRKLLSAFGLEQVEMKHQGPRTLCCGEGGMVSTVRPAFAERWVKLRRKESGGRRLVTYCAGCCGFLGKTMPTVHLADLLCQPEAVRLDKIPVTRPPLTYLQRLRLKRRLQQLLR
ncbi:(Fe-S)-binding protein [Desulfobulbus alkaliphilus]|uniref:(Fe-S)-binding protein n=1 Tax=Desulfobulbus alkaliphilus TaxID=869814 RepID=UPI00196625D8|nr:(Fe-S)-binding protein [Desulfobulbus alkaliphilus]MBM9535720.1 (Fe-S)-binding protein [Desulfobulbus alkaliphilus]